MDLHSSWDAWDLGRVPVSDWKLSIINQSHIDVAWRDGASSLSKACDKSAGECDAGQLKMRLLRGELILVAAVHDGRPKGWAAVEVQLFPNFRALHVYAIYAPGATGVDVFNLLKDYAKGLGASCVQGACDDAGSRLWEQKHGFKSVYRIMRYDLWAADHKQ